MLSLGPGLPLLSSLTLQHPDPDGKDQRHLENTILLPDTEIRAAMALEHPKTCSGTTLPQSKATQTRYDPLRQRKQLQRLMEESGLESGGKARLLEAEQAARSRVSTGICGLRQRAESLSIPTQMAVLQCVLGPRPLTCKS